MWWKRIFGSFFKKTEQKQEQPPLQPQQELQQEQKQEQELQQEQKQERKQEQEQDDPLLKALQMMVEKTSIFAVAKFLGVDRATVRKSLETKQLSSKLRKRMLERLYNEE